jgi:hypothetical protein
VEVKKYTESHEWIELAEDGKTGESSPLLLSHHIEPSLSLYSY